MKRIYCLFLIFCIVLPSLAQESKVDSLLFLIKKDKEDTNKVNHLNALAIELWGNLDTALICSKAALDVAKKIKLSDDEIGWQKGIGRSNYLIGIFHFDKGDFVEALSYNSEALQIWESMEQKLDPNTPEFKLIRLYKAKSNGEIGNAYWGLGNYPKALEYQLRCLKINEEMKFEKGIGSTLGNIGNIYNGQKNYEKALEYYQKSLKVSKKFGNKYDISIDLRNVGNIYRYLNNSQKSLEHLMMALVVSKELGNDLETANNMASIGALLQNEADSLIDAGADPLIVKEKYDKVMDYYSKSLKLDEEIGNDYGVAMNLSNMGGVYAKQKKYKEAEDCFLKALAIDSATGSLQMMKTVHESLSLLYSVQGEHKKALAHYKAFASVKDSLFNEDKNKEITRHEMNYEFEKKESVLKAEQEKKEAVAVSERKRQNIFFWLISSVALAVALIAIVILRSLRTTKKQKQIIEVQKDLVEEKQREVLDSIHYARRIQKSLLPTELYIQKNMDRLRKAK